MATNKAKRSIHLTQPNHPPAELMPVRAHVYRTIADVNGGFEHVIEGLQILQKIKYLSSDGLDQTLNLVCRIRAQANRELIAVIDQRETANAGHYQQLCLEPKKESEKDTEKAVNH
jgi:hypothetical protein